MASVKRDEEKEKKSATTGVTGAGRRSSPFINVKVKNQENGEVFFRIRRSAQLRKLMTTYCEHQCVDIESIAFLLDGTRIKAEHTPDELEMKDGDEIDAMPRISFQEAKRRKKEEAELKVKKLNKIAEKQRQRERELEERKAKLDEIAEEQRQRERELEERKVKLDEIAEEQKFMELEEQRKVKKLVCPDIFTVENELKSWCVQNGRSITPSAFMAIAHCIVGSRGGINPAEDIPKMMLGWDARGDQILFGVKNTSTAMQEVLKGFTTIHANMEMMIEGQQRTQTTAPLSGHHE